MVGLFRLQASVRIIGSANLARSRIAHPTGSNMNKSLCASLCLAAIGLSASAIGSAATHNNFIAEQSRTPTGGRSLQVLVAQAEIKSNINPSNIAVATGGGLLG